MKRRITLREFLSDEPRSTYWHLTALISGAAVLAWIVAAAAFWLVTGVLP